MLTHPHMFACTRAQIDGFIGSTWVCIGMLCVPLAVFVTCGGCVIKRVRHVSR